jgi:hypothetical protein
MSRTDWTGRATIIQGDRKAEVVCELGAGGEWGGRYRGAQPDNEPDVGPAELKLPAGDATAIVVTDRLPDGKGNFVGRGPYPG